MSHSIQYHQVHAPRTHEGTYIDPPLEQWPRAVEQNRRQAADPARERLIGGLAWRELRAQARAQLVADARRYTAAYLPEGVQEIGPGVQGPLLLAGHQPELFHPGVWFKNFVLSAAAQRLGGTAINLIVDNDVVSAPAVRVVRDAEPLPRVEIIPLDTAGREMPWEERTILDDATFADFAAQVARPLADRLWKHAVALRREAGFRLLGSTLAAARHRLEAEWGLRTLELPFSQVCERPAFARFALHLLADLERFHTIHNESLAEFRRVHRLRSRTHPVPNLTRDGSWLEAPFWLWSGDDPRRRPLFAARRGDELLLTDRGAVRIALPLMDGQVHEGTLAGWLAARWSGVKFRPRALMTTMYARLVLGDWFLHGIGGAKYDQLTDALIERFWRCAPPRFATATATVRAAPVEPWRTEEALRGVTARLRSLSFHPETFLNDQQRTDPAIAELVAEKQRWIAADPPAGARRERHLALAAVNAALCGHLGGVEAGLQEELANRRHQLARERLLGTREASFCLFDDHLPSLLLRLAAPLPNGR